MAHHVRIRLALATLTVFATALAGCAGQPGEQEVLNEPQAAGDLGAPNEYSESTPAPDPTTPAARDKPPATSPATRRPARQPAPRTEETGESDQTDAPRAPRPPAANTRTTRPPVTTGPPQPGRGDGTHPTTRPPVTTGPPQPPTTAPPPPPPTTSAPPGLDFGPDECAEGNDLPRHDGFQNGGRCVDTEMGELADAANNPSLLITDAPERVGVNQPFTIRVSTRNLVRDRFLPAGRGGYYVDMSILNERGLVRGHFHTACRVLTSTRVAPEPAPAPAFFVATEDSRGGTEPDIIEIRVPGLPQEGTFQCSAWAGDASHRVPMMQRANQIPALDSVRVEVR
ncbi:Pecanex-like protein 1 [Phytohabitans sp. LJ34]|uniref:Pecanex-like protein 1 n=1 Tax=Phytohabitans sp. LJ34 TaxID=3452217 RepID=UPI003F8CDF32